MDSKDSFTIRDLPRSERPRERLRRLGADALSSQELLALLIGRGVRGRSALTIAQELIGSFGNVRAVAEATVEELSRIKGIGTAKAVQLQASFELAKRQELYDERKQPQIKGPADVASAVRKGIRDKAREHFKLVLLTTRNYIIDIATISIGTLNASLVHPREVFKKALLHSAASVILVHNHPSNDPEPSEDDISLTRRLAEAGKLMGIEVLDHIIVTEHEHLSFKERGLL